MDKKDGMSKTVTVVIPIYNVEKYLNRCIESVAGQTYKNLEIILVDDESPDNCPKICEDWKNRDNRIKVIHKKNGGLSSARNAGLAMAGGRYIGFVDSDDYIKNDMYEKLLKCIIDYNADISVCGVVNDHLIMKKEFKYYNGIKVFSTSDEILDSYFKYPYLGDTCWNKLYKADLWENFRFPEMKCREDIAILYKIYFSCKKIVRMGDCKYIQYIRPGSTEQKAFTEDKLISIDIAKNQVKYIKVNYPKYYKNVEDIVLRRYVDCLEEIVSGGYLKNKCIFDKVLNDYKLELNHFNTNSSERYNDPLKKKYFFILKVKIFTIKKKCLNLIKNIVSNKEN